MTTIGFIGVGHMGNPMVKNLQKAGHQLLVYDVNPETKKEVTAQGAKDVDDLKTLAQQAEVIFSSVQTGQQVNEICLGPEGIFENARKDLLYIDCSSIDIVTTVLLHDKALEYGVHMLDAPVSGGVKAASEARLTFMVGGEASDFKRALPLLQQLGKKIVHAGPGGHGQAAKICNNLLLGITMIGVSEAFTLAERLGLDPKKFFEISSNASGSCWAMTNYCPMPGIIEGVPSNNNYEPGFMAKMMLKDLRLGQHAAQAVDAIIPLGSVATELYELYVKEGYGDKDFSGIINLIAKQQTS